LLKPSLSRAAKRVFAVVRDVQKAVFVGVLGIDLGDEGGCKGRGVRRRGGRRGREWKLPVGGRTLLTNTNIAWTRVRERLMGEGELEEGASGTFSELSLMRLRMT
jgi:hypothetical protein